MANLIAVLSNLVLFTLAQAPSSAQSASGGQVAGGIGAILFCLFFIVAAAIGVLSLVLWIWMLVDAATRNFENDSEKIVWVIIIVLTGVVGALIYLVIGRSRGVKA